MPEWKLFFSYTPFFNYTIHQSTNAYNFNGNDSAVGRSSYSNPDDSLGYCDINDVVVVI